MYILKGSFRLYFVTLFYLFNLDLLQADHVLIRHVIKYSFCK